MAEIIPREIERTLLGIYAIYTHDGHLRSLGIDIYKRV